jgi:hypothetical protein
MIYSGHLFPKAESYGDIYLFSDSNFDCDMLDEMLEYFIYFKSMRARVKIKTYYSFRTYQTHFMAQLVFDQVATHSLFQSWKKEKLAQMNEKDRRDFEKKWAHSTVKEFCIRVHFISADLREISSDRLSLYLYLTPILNLQTERFFSEFVGGLQLVFISFLKHPNCPGRYFDETSLPVNYISALEVSEMKGKIVHKMDQMERFYYYNDCKNSVKKSINVLEGSKIVFIHKTSHSLEKVNSFLEREMFKSTRIRIPYTFDSVVCSFLCR